MDARRRVLMIALAAALVVATLVVPGASLGDVYVRVQGGWLDVAGGASHGVGYAYLGGAGGSGEIGIDLMKGIVLSGEFGPRYDQPPRNIPQNADIDGSHYSTILGNLRFRFEPIESLEPYLLLGGGQSVYHFDYDDAGKPFIINGTERRFTEETQEAWTLAIGLGFDTPISSRLYWGVRTRYLAHRWRSVTDKDRSIAYPSGHAWAFDGGLSLRF